MFQIADPEGNVMNTLTLEFFTFAQVKPEYGDEVLLALRKRGGADADLVFGHLSATDRRGHHIVLTRGSSFIVAATGANVDSNWNEWNVAGWAKLPAEGYVRAFCGALAAGTAMNVSNALERVEFG